MTSPTAAVRIDDHLAQLAADGPRLADAAERAGWDAPVPATEWTVRELVTHLGDVHRWATDIVATRSMTTDTALGSAPGSVVPDEELSPWFRQGHAALLDTLRAAPADLDCATFLPAPSPMAFWARRQAHETAIHRADAEAAAGRVSAFAADFAQDGMAELLHGFARRRSNAIARRATLGLAASDGPGWTVTLGGERIEAEQGASVCDTTVSGTSSDLYLWLWNRPAAVTVTGDETVAALWRNVRIG